MIFIIHSLNMIDEAIELEKELGIKCYIPGRDTNQNQNGEQILFDNLKAMKSCVREVYCIWDGESLGTMFDMGMAFALDYSIVPYKLGKDKHWKRFFKHKLDVGEKIEFNFELTGKYYNKEN